MPNRTDDPDVSFAYYFGIARTPADDWFDPRLHTDTDVFVDPFLMFDETSGHWADTHDRLIDFFNTALEHVAHAGGIRESREWRRASAMLSFPEPPEFCLGYGNRTIFGSGSGSRLGRDMLKAANDAIQAGVDRIESFGELLLFGEHFGADRISDMVCNIVKDLFVEYTIEICQRHSVPTERITLRHDGYDYQHDRWRNRPRQLPINPNWRPRTPVLLVPNRFLAELPNMGDVAFWDWVYRNQNEQLRQDLGYAVTLDLNKKEIIERAKRSIRLRRKYGIRYAEASKQTPPKPYDFSRDPKLKIVAFDTAQSAVEHIVLTPPADQDALCDFVRELLEKFKTQVEKRGSWKSMWLNGDHRDEKEVHRIFSAVGSALCEIYDVDMSPEVDEGVGPVDFKFSRGSRRKVLAEFKLAGSSHFWDNLDQQLPAYLEAAAVECGYFVVVQLEHAHRAQAYIDRVEQAVATVATRTKKTYRVMFVDATKRDSASKLKRKKAAPAKRAAAKKRASKRITPVKRSARKRPPPPADAG